MYVYLHIYILCVHGKMHCKLKKKNTIKKNEKFDFAQQLYLIFQFVLFFLYNNKKLS